MPKISKEGGPTVYGSQEPVDLNTPVTLHMLSQVLDYLGLAVWIEGPGGVRHPGASKMPSGRGGIWLGSHGYK